MMLSERDKCRFYCSVCGHPIVFTLHQEQRICSWCNCKIKRPEKSVYDISLIKALKSKHKLFLKKKEGMLNEI